MSDEIQEWIDAYFDGRATPEILGNLERSLLEDDGVRIRFLDEANMLEDLSRVLSVEDGEPEVLPLPSPQGNPVRKRWGMAIAASLVLGLGSLFYSLSNSDKPTNPASLVLVEGEAQMNDFQLGIGERMEPPGLLTSEPGEAVVLRYPDGSILTLEGGSALRLETGKGKRVFLEYGSLVADMQRQPEGKDMVMETANSTVTVLGTKYSLATTVVEDILKVEHGKVRVLEKKTNKELVATQGTIRRVPGVNKRIFPDPPEPGTPTSQPIQLAKNYKPSRSWFVEDFDLEWNRRFWELSTQEVPEYHLLAESAPEAYFVKTFNIQGFPGQALLFSRPPGSPPTRLRLDEKVGWDHYFLKYYFKPQGDAPFGMSPLCLDLPEGTGIETTFQAEGPEPLELPEIWNRVVLEYLRFWDGEKWQVEVRRHLNFEHRSTTILDIGRTPEILMELLSGSCLMDFISVGQLTPYKDSRKNPFEKWVCTEDFDPQYYDPLWDVKSRDGKMFYPIGTPGKGVILQKMVGIRGTETNVLPLSYPTKPGSPSQLRLRRRVLWDDFVLQYEYRKTSDAPLEVAPLCLQLPEGTPQEIVFENELAAQLEYQGGWNKARLEYHISGEVGDRHVEVIRRINNKHHSTIRVAIEQAPRILLEVKSGAGVFDWIDVRKLDGKTAKSGKIPK